MNEEYDSTAGVRLDRVVMPHCVAAGKPFHELTDAEFDALKAAGATWGDMMRDHPQPEWCSYPDALGGAMGCWSLVGRMVTGRDYCKDCELCKPLNDAA